MNDSNRLRQIKEEDTRALNKFAIIMIIAIFVGAFLGVLATFTKYTMADIIRTGAINLLRVISPYAPLTVTIITAIIIIFLYKKSLVIYEQWDGDNEEELNRVETLLSYALWISNISMILSYFFFGASIVLNSLKDPYDILEIIRFVLLFGGLIATILAMMLEQQKIVNLEKKINPEKKGSVFDVRFAKKWEESCDEAEKLTIYKSAYKSYQTVNMTCIILWVLSILGSFIWNFGIMPFVMVTILWIVSISSYCLEAIRLAKNPSKIHK